jgi:hypothetical protein
LTDFQNETLAQVSALCEGFVLSGARGIRSSHETPREIALPEVGGAESGALTPTDPDLSRLVTAWPTLPEPIKRAVLALVDSATE